jgi:hypothetical protein
MAGAAPERFEHPVAVVAQPAAETGAVVLVDIASGARWELNPTAAFVWQRLGEGLTVAAVARQVAERFGADAAAAARDVDAVLVTLREAGLVVARAETG